MTLTQTFTSQSTKNWLNSGRVLEELESPGLPPLSDVVGDLKWAENPLKHLSAEECSKITSFSRD